MSSASLPASLSPVHLEFRNPLAEVESLADVAEAEVLIQRGLNRLGGRLLEHRISLEGAEQASEKAVFPPSGSAR